MIHGQQNVNVIVIHNDTRSTECYVIVVYNYTRSTKRQKDTGNYQNKGIDLITGEEG
jgi:hypothetical protein